MSEHPVITIGFTCGDLRGSTIPLGSFSSPEGARLYALALGIPREAVHIEAVSVSTPIHAEANAPGAERVRQAQKALAAFERLHERLAPTPGEMLDEALTRQLVAAQEEGAEFAALEAKIEELEEKLRQAISEQRELRDERDEIAQELESVREAGEHAASAAAELAEDLVRGGGSLSGRLRSVGEALERHSDDLNKLAEVLASLPDAKRVYPADLVTTATEVLRELRDRVQREHDDPLPEQATDTLRALGLEVSTLDPNAASPPGAPPGTERLGDDRRTRAEKIGDHDAKIATAKPARRRATKVGAS